MSSATHPTSSPSSPAITPEVLALLSARADAIKAMHRAISKAKRYAPGTLPHTTHMERARKHEQASAILRARILAAAGIEDTTPAAIAPAPSEPPEPSAPASSTPAPASDAASSAPVLAGDRLALWSWAEQSGWPRLAIASATGAGSHRAPYLHVAEGAHAWERFTRHAERAHIRLALAAAGIAPEPEPIERSAVTSASSTASSTSQSPSSEGEPGESTRRRDALGVLDVDGLWLAGADREAPEHITGADIPQPGPDVDALALLTLARAYELGQLWVHPRYALAAGMPTEHRNEQGKRVAPYKAGAPAYVARAIAAGWDVRPAGLAAWLHAFQRGTYGAVDIALPHLETRIDWREAPDGPALLLALVTFAEALHLRYRSSPGATATRLMRLVHSGNAASLSIEAPASLPPVARRRTGIEPDYSWIRPLTEAERRRKYLHSYDVHGQYLAACSSLALGFGEAEHRTAGEGAPLAFDRAMPGYWRARIALDVSALVPDPFTPGGRPLRSDPGQTDAPRWHTTPTLTLAAELGAAIAIDEAYVWPVHHRALEPWYKRLRDARSSLGALAAAHAEAPGYALALAAVKRVYTQGIGWLDGRWLADSPEPEDLYRPDWRHAVMGQARANWTRRLWKCAAVGVYPFAVHKDAAYFASDEPDPVQACPPALPLGDGLGRFSVHDSVPLASVAPILDELYAGARDTAVLRRLLMALGELAGEDRAGALMGE